MPDDEHELDPVTWTVQANDGVIHRAMRQYGGWDMFVITACDFWKRSNMAGEVAPVNRENLAPTCMVCVMYDLARVSGAYCKHCGVAASRHQGAQSHVFEAAP